MKRVVVTTPNAPKAIGTYSQAVKIDNTVYLSGQIPLIAQTMDLEEGDMRAQISRVFENLSAVAKAAGGSLQDAVKLNVYLTDLTNFPIVNEVMAQYIKEPYPARAVVGVAALPRGVAVEIDAVLVLGTTSKSAAKPAAKAKTKAKPKPKKKAKRK
jgi:reactive intermediate/imine deaminase